MKVWIEGQETYPDYVFFTESESNASDESAIEVDEETYARWVRVSEQYAELQRELGALAEANHKKWLANLAATANREQWHASMPDEVRYGQIVSARANAELRRRMGHDF